MFSASLEAALTIAYREAASRRHADRTVEHLLYSLAHDSDGERIMAACGVDLSSLRHELDAFLTASVDQFKRNADRGGAGLQPQRSSTAEIPSYCRFEHVTPPRSVTLSCSMPPTND